MAFYLNGTLQGKKSINKVRKRNNKSLHLGQRGDGNGPIAKALYDELRIWNRALSKSEIAFNAKNGKDKVALDNLQIKIMCKYNQAK